jgi:hypothetical protein
MEGERVRVGELDLSGVKGMATTPPRHMLEGWPTVMGGKGRVRVGGWGLGRGEGGTMPYQYMDLERLTFYIDYPNSGNKRCRRMRGMKLGAVGECVEWN